MKRALRTLSAAALLALASGCGDDADDSPAATLAPATTERTTTTLSVEAEVEAAYLKSWDVYSKAVRTFETSQLADVYTGRALELVRSEVARLDDSNTPIVVQVEHDVTVDVGDDVTALLTDRYVNRNYRVDGTTGQPIDDPNDPGTYVETYLMTKVGGKWLVSTIERQSHSA